MERGDGYGSPLAFVIGGAFELFLFIPLLVLLIVGLFLLGSLGKRQNVRVVES